ncbi:tyrosine-type recombinase/integrase [Peribacillus simplex]|uniref:tyrosine-type recombinase/integrase n=1 Tax=Peribacillus simplex TaxID=1478 RepID=UPI0037C79B9D
MEELQSYKVKKQAQLLKVWLKLIEDHFVVSAFGGKPVNPNTIHKQFLYDIKLAGRKRIRFHDLRHTHATIMLEIGENSKVVSERLGHSKVTITKDYSEYTGLLCRKLFKSSRQERMDQ